MHNWKQYTSSLSRAIQTCHQWLFRLICWADEVAKQKQIAVSKPNAEAERSSCEESVSNSDIVWLQFMTEVRIFRINVLTDV